MVGHVGNCISKNSMPNYLWIRCHDSTKNVGEINETEGAKNVN